MSGYQVRSFAEVDAFLSAAGDFLAAREAEHNLMLGLCSVMQKHPESYPTQHFYAVYSGDEVVLASLRTPPHVQILSETGSDNAVCALVEYLLRNQSDVPGVLGPKYAARVFSELACTRLGKTPRVTIAQRIYRASRVSPPGACPGYMRDAEESDRELLGSWYEAFHDEAAAEGMPKSSGAKMASLWLERAGRRAFVWEREGEVVCLAGTTGETPRGIRVGPVYTPPKHRGAGYASNLVAALTTMELKTREFCFLFTNLANPTSNGIYQAVGYESVTEVDQVRFE